MAYEAIERVIRETGADVELSKEDDIQKMLAAGVRTMPAIVVDGMVVVKGYVPSDAEIRKILEQ
jgi:predicted DsbA family dithiol-disulfide isomerase